MNKKCNIKKFFRFLKDKNIFKQYIEYVSKEEYFVKPNVYLKRVEYKTVKDFFENSYNNDLVLHAFVWERTKEGIEFWTGIFNNWFNETHIQK